MAILFKYGIDIGTTNSSIAIVRENEDGDLEIFPFTVEHFTEGRSEGNATPEMNGKIIRSVVGFQENGTPLVGEEALYGLKTHSADNPIQDFKPEILSASSDDYFNALDPDAEHRYRYSDIVAALLGKLFSEAQKEIEQKGWHIKISGVIMGVPNVVGNEGETQKSDIVRSIYRAALVKCGFCKDEEDANDERRVEFLQESLAVALFYGQRISRRFERALVCDFGGGTLDLALVDLNQQDLNGSDRESVHRVIAKDGTDYAGNVLTKFFFIRGFIPVYSGVHFGGRSDYLAQLFREAGFTNSSNFPELWKELGDSALGVDFKNAIDNLKIQLCNARRVGRKMPVTFHYSFASNERTLNLEDTDFVYEDFLYSVTRQTSPTGPYYDPSPNHMYPLDVDMKRIDELVEANKGDGSQKIREIFLAGGSSLVPAFKETIINRCDSQEWRDIVAIDPGMQGKDIVNLAQNDLEVMTCTAQGLAYEGHQTSAAPEHIDDVTDFDYGYYDYALKKVRVVLPAKTRVSEALYPGNGIVSYAFSDTVKQTDPSAKDFYLDIREGDSPIMRLTFDKGPYSGKYTIFFCMTKGTTNSLQIYVFDAATGQPLNTIPLKDRTYQINHYSL